MKISCPNCRAPVVAEDVNLATGLARCRTCNHVFRFGDPPEPAPPTVRARARAEKPRSVVVFDANGELTVQFRWFALKYVILAVLSLLWNGFLAGWYTIVEGGHPLLFVFPLLHAAVGIFLLYVTLAGLVNTTTVRIGGSRLCVSHHPLPWGRGVDLGVADVKQLFCEAKIVHGRGGVSYTYDLNALMRDGTRRKVVYGIEAPELPLYLEQHAESWMRIEDEPVAGELPR
ncbi:MAG: MJ0042-type zinc finger domain-containing protein [Longimicrobiaceae bacterium]